MTLARTDTQQGGCESGNRIYSMVYTTYIISTIQKVQASSQHVYMTCNHKYNMVQSIEVIPPRNDNDLDGTATPRRGTAPCREKCKECAENIRHTKEAHRIYRKILDLCLTQVRDNKLFTLKKKNRLKEQQKTVTPLHRYSGSLFVFFVCVLAYHQTHSPCEYVGLLMIEVI